MFQYNGKTDNDLRVIAEHASTDFLTNGTELTQAVAKIAAQTAQDLTSEHIARICEFAYHDTYNRMFAEKQGSADRDRYITFDPPNSIVASDLYQKTVQTGLQPSSPGGFSSIMKKMASDAAYPIPRHKEDVRTRLAKIAEADQGWNGVKFQPMNQFQRLMEDYTGEDTIPEADPFREKRAMMQDFTAAKQELQGQLASAINKEREEMNGLFKWAHQLSNQGLATDQILHAGATGVPIEHDGDWEVLQKVATQVALRLPREKLAGEVSSRVNPRHPFVQKFASAVQAFKERVTLEFAVDDITRQEQSFWNGINV